MSYVIECDFNEYAITFELTNNKFVITCRCDGIVFCIRNDTICIYQFINAMQFFELSNTQDELSEAFIEYCLDGPIYSVKRLDKLTGYILSYKLREVANIIGSQKIIS